jgi:processive 1,2-diacylglycerol beta-glucosyltransferase
MLSALIRLEGNRTTSCGYHRLQLPYSRLVCSPRHPVMVFNRRPPGGLQAIRVARAHGYKIVADVDDFWLLPADHYLQPRYGAEASIIAACVAAADVVTVTNEVLADKVRAVAEHVVVVPNALPFDEDQFGLAATPGNRVVYAGGPSHLNDLRVAGDALRALGTGLTMVGVDRAHHVGVAMAQEFPEATMAGVLPVASYMRAYDGARLAVAPLQPTEWNACKSNLKTLEAGARGIPLVAQRWHPYLNPVDAPFVTYAHDAFSWAAEIVDLWRREDLARERGAALAAHVREHYDLRKVNEIRRQLIESL